MAARVKLVRRRDWSSDISSLSLFNFEDGFSLARDGWIQAVAGDDDIEIAEAMTLHVEGTDHDDLASKIQALNDKIREVGWHDDAGELYGVWLQAQMPDETEARQALITSMQSEPVVSFYAPTVAPGNFMRAGLSLALERTPFWETLTHSPLGVTGSTYCRGAVGDYSARYGTIAGDVPARIARTAFSAATGGPLYEFWLGFRTDRWGDRSNFVPIWDLGQSSDSASHNSTTSIHDAGGTVYGDYHWRCSFANEAMLKRVVAVINTFASYPLAQRGEHLILLRAKVGSSTVCHVRLLDGYTTSDALRTQPRVKITATDWMLYPLGTVNIPPERGIPATFVLDQYGFEIQASRESGSGDLDIDYVCLIPRGEGAIHVSGGAVIYSSGDTKPVRVRVSPDGRTSGWGYLANAPVRSVTVEPENYNLPVGDGMFVLAGQRETSHVLTDRVTVSFLIYPRWRTLRGADTIPPLR